MDERKFMILKAIIDDYIMTAVPVGSRTISRKEGVGFSAATIRNEMSDLEALGYLDQPHTSAGRVPSAKAYRLYVDQVLKVYDLTREETERITNHLNARASQVETVIRRTAQILSDATKYTSVVVAPHMETMRLKRVQMVPITDKTALVIIVTNGGIIKDAVIRIPAGLTNDNLFALSEMLTGQLEGLTISQMRQRFAEMFKDLKEHRRLLANVLDVMENRIADAENADMVVGGSSNLLSYPEYSDVEKARLLLNVLESKERLYPIIQKAGGMEFTIRIGPENDLPEMRDLSVITANYRIGNETSGTMSVIGPTRMDYQRVVSVLNCMGRVVSEILGK